MPTASELKLEKGDFLRHGTLSYVDSETGRHGNLDLTTGPVIEILEINVKYTPIARGTKVRYLDSGSELVIDNGYVGFIEPVLRKKDEVVL